MVWILLTALCISLQVLHMGRVERVGWGGGGGWGESREFGGFASVQIVHMLAKEPTRSKAGLDKCRHGCDGWRRVIGRCMQCCDWLSCKHLMNKAPPSVCAGVAEMLAMEMKSSGMYVSRGLSYKQAEVGLGGWVAAFVSFFLLCLF